MCSKFPSFTCYSFCVMNRTKYYLIIMTGWSNKNATSLCSNATLCVLLCFSHWVMISVRDDGIHPSARHSACWPHQALDAPATWGTKRTSHTTNRTTHQYPDRSAYYWDCCRHHWEVCYRRCAEKSQFGGGSQGSGICAIVYMFIIGVNYQMKFQYRSISMTNV